MQQTGGVFRLAVSPSRRSNPDTKVHLLGQYCRQNSCRGSAERHDASPLRTAVLYVHTHVINERTTLEGLNKAIV